MKPWKLDDGRIILLLTPLELSNTPVGTELVCIDGTTAVLGRDHIDNDTRGGCLAYGVLQARKAVSHDAD